MTYKVLCTDGFSEAGLNELKKCSELDVTYEPSLTHEDLVNKIGSYNALIVRSASKVSRDVIEKGNNLKIIVRAGVGTDNIDLEAATAQGILVANAPAGNSVSTAELTFAMLISLARNIPQAACTMAEGKWEKKRFKGEEIYHKNLGIIGMGRIGREVARRAQAFEMNVMGYDPYLTKEQFEAIKVKPATVEEICKQADYITVHTPLTAETENIITTKQISLMKTTTRIINCARGGIVNEKDLATALKEKRIAGAALDVFTTEPFNEDYFKGLDNCVLTPHLGASTGEAQDAVAIEASQGVIQFFTEGISSTAVNLVGADQKTWQEFRSHISLAEHLGSLATQLGSGGISKIVFCSSREMPRLLTLASLKGAFSTITDANITLVNAENFAQERGTSVGSEVSSLDQDLKETIGVKVFSDAGEVQVWGKVLADETLKIIRCNDYRLNIDPEGYILFIHNEDTPGVIGRICTILGENRVNIAEMQNVRKNKGAEALTIIGIDEEISSKTIEQIAQEKDIKDVKLVKL